MDFSPRALARRFLAGLLMGGADVIPGVSGGTMALIVGVYSGLIGAISDLFAFALRLARLDAKRALVHWRAVDWGLVLPLGAGIAAALVVGARFIPALMEAYPVHMNGLFLGLVAGSLLIPWLRIEHVRAGHAGVMLALAALAFWLTGLPTQGDATDPSLVRVFVSAAVAICAMILPGVSGAFLLKAMGLYAPTLAALNTLDLAYVATFCLGAGLGLGTFASALDWLLAHAHDWTMAALIGLIAGALRALWPYTTGAGALRLPDAGEPVLTVALLALAGLAAVVGLTWWGVRQARDAAARDAAEATPVG